MVDSPDDLAAEPAVLDDLSALAWVQQELQRSLEAALKALRRTVRDAEALQGGDVDDLDPGVLRGARQHLHQGASALELIGLPAGAAVLRACENAVQRHLARPRGLPATLVGDIERATFALMDYLGRLLAGRPVSPLAMFPQYRAVQEASGAERVHPADLWEIDWQWRALPADDTATPRQPDAATRAAFEQQLLALMRGAVRPATRRMSEICAALGSGATALQEATLWKLASAVFEAQTLGLLAPDIHSKRVASRLLAQLRSIERGGLHANDGRTTPSPSERPRAIVSERLAQDLVFFCGQAVPTEGGRSAPRLEAARAAYGLTAQAPVDYASATLGRYNPAWIVQARKRVGAAKDAWSQVAAGDLQRTGALAEQMSLLGDSLTRIFPTGDRLAAELQSATRQAHTTGAPPSAPLAMEVATALLYIEASLEDNEFEDPKTEERLGLLSARVADAAADGPARTLEPWMEELYRRVSDGQMMGSVVHELRASLTEVEGHMDRYFRDPSKRELLVPVPNTLASMRGVLSVLGLEQAAAALQRMRHDVEALAATEIDVERGPQPGTFERLADNLGALGFLIDMLGVQPQLAKTLFAYDPDDGSFSPVMGRHGKLRVPAAEVEAEPRVGEVAGSTAAAGAAGAAGAASSASSASSNDAADPAQGSLADAAAPGSSADAAHGADHAGTVDAGAAHDSAVGPAAELDAGGADGAAVTAPDNARVAAPVAAEAVPPDDDMRAIFLEEAREVVATAEAALAGLHADPADVSQAVVLRRAFHTLKGSARMVGLEGCGAAGWGCEQVLNAHLARQRPADTALLAFLDGALPAFAGWNDAVAAGDDSAAGHAALVARADAVRAGWVTADPAAMPAAPASSEPAPLPELGPVPAEAAQPVDVDATPVEAFAPPFGAAAGSADGVEVPETSGDEAAHASLVGDHAPSLADAPSPVTAADATSLVPSDDGDADAAAAAEANAKADADADADAQPVADAPHVTPSPFAPTPQDPAADASVDADADSDADSDADADALAVAAGAGRGPGAADAAVGLGAQDEAAAEPDHYKHVGPLRIGMPLFNIYLNEADELSRRLCSELAEWSQERDRPPGEAAIALAHSLAGSSSTVGFADLSRLCRLLEHALTHVDASGAVDARDAELFVAVADDIRRLLHQFAAGFLKTPQPDLQARLTDITSAPPTRADAPADAAESSDQAPEDTQPDGLAHESASASLADAPATDDRPALAKAPSIDDSPTLDDAPVIDDGPVIDDALALDAGPALDAAAATDDAPPAPPVVLSAVPELGAYAPLAVPVAPAAHHALPDADDDIDAVDVIDADLFPVFEEEGLELLPLISSKLREWAERPHDPSLPAAVMRTLHTLKGGARLSGAMRLGELAHRLEYRIEEVVASGAARRADIEALQTRADRLDGVFDALRTHDADRYTAAIEAAGAPVSLQPGGPALAAPHEATDEASFDTDTVRADAAATPDMSLPAAAPSDTIDWSPWLDRPTAPHAATQRRGVTAVQSSVRVRAPVLDRLVNQIGEVSIARSRLSADVGRLRSHLGDLTDNLDRLRSQLRDVELQAELQMSSRLEAAKAAAGAFDPLEFDRYTRFQELTRMMAESVNDVATVQRGSQRTLESAEDELASLASLTRDLQGDLLRSRMVEFESLSDRLYRVVRQAAKDTGKQVRLDIVGGGIEVDRGVLDRMTPAFEHLLRNSMAHGIESAEVRAAATKDPVGTIVVALAQEGNEVAVEFRDDGAGLDLARIRERAVANGLLAADAQVSDDVLANLIYTPGFSTADAVTELAGRGVGMDVVRSEVNAIGGRIETATTRGAGSSFKLVLPLTTAVTQVLMLRCGDLTVAVPSTLVESVRRATDADVTAALAGGSYALADERLPFYWFGALMQHSQRSTEAARTRHLLIVQSARQRIAVQVDEVLGNQEVVVKNLGPQLSRLPGLAGVTLLTSGAVAPIYNPVALATLYGDVARSGDWPTHDGRAAAPRTAASAASAAPLVLVVDDSLTVRRITQRLLTREGYRVTLAKDGLDALERLAEEKPMLVLSDIEMPRMDGFDLVRNIRADAGLRDLPVIMITSRIANKHREYAAELGVSHYLGKPYPEDELLALVARAAEDQGNGRP